MAQKSHFWPWYGPSLGASCAKPLFRNWLIFYMHVRSCLECTYVFISMNFEPVAKH